MVLTSSSCGHAWGSVAAKLPVAAPASGPSAHTALHGSVLGLPTRPDHCQLAVPLPSSPEAAVPAVAGGVGGVGGTGAVAIGRGGSGGGGLAARWLCGANEVGVATEVLRSAAAAVLPACSGASAAEGVDAVGPCGDPPPCDAVAAATAN